MNPAVVVAIGVVLGVALAYVLAYNKLVTLRNRIAESWSNVDTELKRRHDLVPNLVAVVKGAAAHERGLIEEVAKMRADAVRLQGQGRAAQQQAENDLARGMGRLIAVVEANPAIRTSGNFLQLQRALVETEDRIQAARRFYNSNVRDNNNYVETFPSSIVARWGGFQTRHYLELDDPRERTSPAVRL